jgi:hypothetical protein
MAVNGAREKPTSHGGHHFHLRAFVPWLLSLLSGRPQKGLPAGPARGELVQKRR